MFFFLFSVGIISIGNLHRRGDEIDDSSGCKANLHFIYCRRREVRKVVNINFLAGQFDGSFVLTIERYGWRVFNRIRLDVAAEVTLDPCSLEPGYDNPLSIIGKLKHLLVGILLTYCLLLSCLRTMGSIGQTSSKGKSCQENCSDEDGGNFKK